MAFAVGAPRFRAAMMRLPGRTSKRTSWIAIVVVLAAALAPATTGAFSTLAGTVPGWGEICTAQGRISAPASSDQGPPSPAGHYKSHIKHCAFCVSHADSLGVPPSTALLVSVAPATHLQPAVLSAAPLPCVAWVPALPRAPPSPS
jgi:Protein of unknown function (DUF2946)